MTDDRLEQDIHDYQRGTIRVYDRVGRSSYVKMERGYRDDLLQRIASGIAERGGEFHCNRVVYRMQSGKLVVGLP